MKAITIKTIVFLTLMSTLIILALLSDNPIHSKFFASSSILLVAFASHKLSHNNVSKFNPHNQKHLNEF